MARVLVITPTLGHSPHLAEAVASVEPFAGRVRHVLVCPSAESARLRGLFPRLEVLDDDTPGVYSAINHGLRVDGDWEAWTWLNDDDRWIPDGIDQVLRMVESLRGTDVLYGRVGYIAADGRLLGEVPVSSHPQWLRGLHAAGVAALSQQGTLVRRSALGDVGMLDTRYRLAADFDWWCRAFRKGLPTAFVDRRVADFRIRSGQLSQQRSAMVGELREIVRSHFDGGVRARARVLAWCFRVTRAGGIIRRYRRTGCWRTSSLLAKYGGLP